MNGYFQLDIRADGTYLMCFPPTDDGAPISFSEVSRYLRDLGLVDYDTKSVNDAIISDEQNVVRIAPSLGHEESGMMDLDISGDYMKAIVRFYPPSVHGSRLTKSDIIESLKKQRVKFGIKEDVIKSFIANPQYCTDYVIAEGEPLVQGQNGSIEYFFETQKNLRPKLNEDGTVDYH